MKRILPLESFRSSDGFLDIHAYYKQFPPLQLEVGGLYVQEPYSWDWKHFRIVYIGHGVALGVVEKGGTYPSNGKELFYCDPGIPHLNGVKYEDSTRPAYRLKARVIER